MCVVCAYVREEGWASRHTTERGVTVLFCVAWRGVTYELSKPLGPRGWTPARFKLEKDPAKVM